eukprot:5325901-Amphidinium_carterae.1
MTTYNHSWTNASKTKDDVKNVKNQNMPIGYEMHYAHHMTRWLTKDAMQKHMKDNYEEINDNTHDFFYY